MQALVGPQSHGQFTHAPACLIAAKGGGLSSHFYQLLEQCSPAAPRTEPGAA